MISLFTYEDAIGHALDYLGVNVSDQASRDCARAVQNAYRELADAFTWSYLYKEGFFITTPTYPPGAIDVIPNVIPSPWGTIEYLHSSGQYPFQITLTGGEWPDWADRGAWLRFSNPPPDVDTGVAVTDFVSYRVAKRWSSTILALDPVINPGRDAPAGTYFVLYRDTYLLPEDYIAQDRAMFSIYPWTMEYVHPNTWLRETRYVFARGNPRNYTITGDDNYYPGRLVIRLYPWPIDERSVTYIYKRRPRPLRLYRVSNGTVTGLAGTSVLTASQPVFTPKMVQAVVRLSLTPGTPPTGPVGFNPPDFESVIIRFNSQTEVELSDPLDVDYTNVPYTVSDRVDIEEVMRTALLRGIEKQIGMSRVLKDKQDAAAQYDMALREAKAADSRSLMGRSVGDAHWFRRRLRDYPIQLGHTT